MLVVLVVGAIYLVKGGAASEAASTGQTVPLEGPAVGARAPGFTALDIDGVPVSLDDYAGRPVWLLFQATWCSICRAELPDVEAASDRIDVVAIYLREDRDLVTDYADRLDLTITSVPDPIGEISLRYLASSVPTHYFVKADGTLAAVRKGAMSPGEINEALALLGVG
ncbi:TlpA family protein disulfide reductase [Tessaracoccus sp. Z1128]